jgi:translation initiation factor IF-3
MAHTDIGRQMLIRLQNDLAPYALVEQQPLMEGRQMVMMMAPKKK